VAISDFFKLQRINMRSRAILNRGKNHIVYVFVTKAESARNEKRIVLV
jgi:hypothetical protein